MITLRNDVERFGVHKEIVRGFLCCLRQEDSKNVVKVNGSGVSTKFSLPWTGDDNEIWNIWRENRKLLKSLGFSIMRFGSEFEVEYFEKTDENEEMVDVEIYAGSLGPCGDCRANTALKVAKAFLVYGEFPEWYAEAIAKRIMLEKHGINAVYYHDIMIVRYNAYVLNWVNMNTIQRRQKKTRKNKKENRMENRIENTMTEARVN